MSIYVVRHGQTDLNKEKRMQGRKGEPLNEEGKKQAERLAQELQEIKFDIIISSPQERAVQTAQIISGISPTIDNRIDVYDMGEADRMKIQDIEMLGLIPNPEKYKGVEKIEEFIYRIQSFMKSIEKIENIKNLNILIVGHKCTVGAIDAYFNNFADLKRSMSNASKNGEYKVYNIKELNAEKININHDYDR